MKHKHEPDTKLGQSLKHRTLDTKLYMCKSNEDFYIHSLLDMMNNQWLLPQYFSVPFTNLMLNNLQALTYRVGHHSTSDDSTKYRPNDEIEYWKMARNPVNKFKRWVERNGWWSDKDEMEIRSSVRKQLLEAIKLAEKEQKPPLEDMFKDVYDQLPSNLKEQERQLRETIKKHPIDYPSDVPL
ncbi:hypothetical protein Lal_00020555 [Lupinus albus]|nr:hypothetical protein Lal_00020555 [Lupinus albus]